MTGANAYLLDGNELGSFCEGFTTKKVAGEEHGRRSFCMGYISGVADSLSALPAIYLQDGVTSAQLVGVVIKYLSDYPERRHHTEDSLVTAALKEKFPCNWGGVYS